MEPSEEETLLCNVSDARKNVHITVLLFDIAVFIISALMNNGWHLLWSCISLLA